MAFKRFPATQDTSVADYDPAVPYADVEWANVGAAEVMNFYNVNPHRAEVLIQFDLSLTASCPSGSKYYLRLADAQHSSTLPSGYHAFIRPLEQAWTEGSGTDMDTYLDLGASNFWQATSQPSGNWALQTGSLSSSFYFVTGHEDLFSDVTDILPVSHHGFDVLPDTEFGTDIYIKKFHSRQSHFAQKRPYLEARWSDWTGSVSTVDLVKSLTAPYSGSLWATATFSSASLATMISSGSASMVSLPIIPVDPTGSLVHSLYNLLPVYYPQETVTLNLLTQLKDWNPATVTTASSATSQCALTKVYYGVTEEVSGEVVVGFGTGSLQHTRLSWNDNGNYFTFDMGCLATGTLYRFNFIYEAPTGSGNWTLIQGNGYRFRIAGTTNG